METKFIKKENCVRFEWLGQCWCWRRNKTSSTCTCVMSSEIWGFISSLSNTISQKYIFFL